MTVILNLPIVRFQFELQARTVLSFPSYAGSTWRGAFGTALKRTVCVTRQPSCTGCLLQRSCVYSQVFETPAGAEPLLSKGTAAPHPFILHPLETSGRQYQVGEHLRIQLTLIGQSIGHLPYFIHSIQQMGEQGVGAKHGQYELLGVWQERCLGTEAWELVYPLAQQSLQTLEVLMPPLPIAPKQVQVVLKTPFRARQSGRLMDSEGFELPVFLTGLIRRLSLLSAYHAQNRLELDFKALTAAARQLAAVETKLQPFEWTRYSSRQQAFIAMDGLVGQFSLVGHDWQAFWPWLWWGQWVHAGKNTAMGQGQYQLENVA